MKTKDFTKIFDTLDKINEAVTEKRTDARTFNPVKYGVADMKALGTCTGCGAHLFTGDRYIGKSGGYPHGSFRLCKSCATKISRAAQKI